MPTYEITAQNIGWYQTLRVDADNKEQAFQLFFDHLRSKEAQDWEQYEFETQHDTRRPRACFAYEISSNEIDEIDMEYGYDKVTLVDSGGNG